MVQELVVLRVEARNMGNSDATSETRGCKMRAAMQWRSPPIPYFEPELSLKTSTIISLL